MYLSINIRLNEFDVLTILLRDTAISLFKHCINGSIEYLIKF
jgi:hypothetical protein